MKSLCSWRRVCTFGLLVGVLAGPAVADDTGTMNVTANVAPSCQLNAVGTMAFGTLDQANNNDAQADITWVCTIGFNTTIVLDGGGSGSIGARAMGGAGTLPYQLYTDSARTIVFGDGTTGSAVGVNGAGYGSPGTVTVYGQVTQANAAAAVAGNYTDAVGVTIIF